MMIASLAFALGAFFASTLPSDPWELRHRYLSAAVVEVDFGEAEQAGVERALATPMRRFEKAGQALVVGTGARGKPRVVLRSGAAFPERFGPALERLGFEWAEGSADRFSFHGRAFTSPDDGLVATFEDPEQPGIPVTLWYANSEAALLDYAISLEPQSRPGFRCFRSGEVELSGGLGVNGLLLTEDMSDLRRAWGERFGSDLRVVTNGFSCRVPLGVDRSQSEAYLEALGIARQRALDWVDSSGAASTDPVASVGVTHVIVHGHAEDMGRLVGVGRLSVVSPITGTVHVLVAEGLPNDGGAAVAESAALRLLGNPVEPWMGPAVGVAVAGTWWGRDLETFCARLVAGDVVPKLTDLVGGARDDFLSPHVRRPMAALFVSHLRERHGDDYLERLWRGLVSLDLEAEQVEWDAMLNGLGAKAPKQKAPVDLRGSWRAGCVLVPGEIGYGARLVDTSLGDMVAAGATAVNLRAFVYRDQPEVQLPGRIHPAEVWTEESDLVLASAAAAAQRLDLEVGLDMHMLVTPSGGRAGDLTMYNAERIEVFFRTYRRVLIHEALVAELIGAQRFSVGTGLTSTSVPRKGAPDLDVINERGWRELIHLANTLFDGHVIYTASSIVEARFLHFADALDLLAVELFPILENGLGDQRLQRGQAPELKALTQRLAGSMMALAKLGEERGYGVLIQSIGFASTSSAWLRADVPRGEASPEIQKLLYSALSGALPRVERLFPGSITGLMMWNWSCYPGAGGLADRGYSPQGKPAATLLPKLFAPPAKQ